jgi:hypothetical protein
MTQYDWERPSYHHAGGLADLPQWGVAVPPIGIFQALKGAMSKSPGSGASSSSSPTSGGVSSNWTTPAIVAIIVAGGLAAYFFYLAQKAAVPVSQKLGEVGGELLKARMGNLPSRHRALLEK